MKKERQETTPLLLIDMILTISDVLRFLPPPKKKSIHCVLHCLIYWGRHPSVKNPQSCLCLRTSNNFHIFPRIDFSFLRLKGSLDSTLQKKT